MSPGLWEECQLAEGTERGLEQKLLFMYCTDLGFHAKKKIVGGEKSLNSEALTLFSHTEAYSNRRLKSVNSQKHARNMENTKKKNKYILGFKKGRKKLNTLV